MSSGSRRFAVLFLAIVVPAAATVVWLGLMLVQQGQALRARQESERRDTLADSVIRTLSASISAAAEDVRAIRFQLSPDGIVPDRGGRVPWLPSVNGLRVDEQLFDETELLEFRGDLSEALARYTALTRSVEPATRAGALQRVARVRRQQSEWDAALAAYRELGGIEGVLVSGMPASLLARRAYCSVLEDAGRRAALVAAATALRHDMLTGRWRMDRAAWELTDLDITRWTGQPLPVSEEERLFTVAAEHVWADWQRGDRLMHAGTRARVAMVEDTPLTLLERLDDRGASVAVLTPVAVRGWLETLTLDHTVTLVSADGTVLAGRPAADPGTPVVRRTTGVTELPWTVLVATPDDARAAVEFARQTRLLWWGLALVVLLLVGGSYLLWRVIQQDRAVARLQTEFVAAVSHEFRTPLASLRHVTELLDEDDELPRAERKSFYQSLTRNTERLSRLVESLLDFARMEGGRKPYALRRVDARDLAHQVVNDFQAEVAPRGYTVRLDMPERALPVSADAESLAHALWNLLDNAVKYSPQGGSVVLSVCAHPRGVAFAVQDRGLGVPSHERTEIFGRFVRGARARELGIKGTGLGLAMVSHIVEAHRGAIELESEEGAGSTFRVVLPSAT